MEAAAGGGAQGGTLRQARPKEGAGGLIVIQVPRPRVRRTGYLHPGEGEWGGLGEDWALLGNGDGSYLGAGL